MLLKYCGVDFEDKLLSDEEFEEKKDEFPYGQVPVLTLKDGT
jgi:glutathione S-transferase